MHAQCDLLSATAASHWQVQRSIEIDAPLLAVRLPWCTEGRVEYQKRDSMLELVKKAPCYRGTGSFTVKIEDLGYIALCPWVERIAH